MVHDLIQRVQKFGTGRVLLVGDLMLDRYIYGDAERISPEAPVPVLRAVQRDERVGGCANVAVCLRALKTAVICCGVIGRDATGQRLSELLTEHGIDTRAIVHSESRPTITKTRFVGLAQHRHRQQLLRLDEEQVGPFPPAEAARIRDLALDAMSQVDVVCIEDYEKGVVSDELVQAIVARAKKLDKPVLVDPGRLTSYERYRGATLLTPNRGELGLVAGCEIDSAELAGECARKLRRELGLDAMIVTLDRDGAVLVGSDGSATHVPTRPRSVYDNTGAGDAVLAMLAAAIAAGGHLLDATRLANVAGGLEVEKFGCVPITIDEVLADLRIEGDRTQGKLRSADDLMAELTLRRDRGETIVFTNGVFDILHAGHAEYLARARAEGSVLVVGLNSDRSVKTLNKGPNRPINTQADRAAVLSALESVTYVVMFDESTPESLIRRVRPDVLVKGADWADKGVIGQAVVESYGGRVRLMPLKEGLSTTALIDRIGRNQR